MNLQIYLDLSYNTCKNFKFYSLQGQNVQSFLIFTYNKGKIRLDFIYQRGGGHLYIWCPWELPPPDGSGMNPSQIEK